MSLVKRVDECRHFGSVKRPGMRVAENTVYEGNENKQIAEEQRERNLEGRSQLLDTPGKVSAERRHTSRWPVIARFIGSKTK